MKIKTKGVRRQLEEFREIATRFHKCIATLKKACRYTSLIIIIISHLSEVIV